MAATILVLVLRAPAVPVVAVGLVAIVARLITGRAQPRRVLAVLGLPVLFGLFGVAVGLGTLGRALVRPVQPALASRPVGNGGPGGRQLCSRQQPPGRRPCWRLDRRSIPLPCWSGSISARTFS